MKKFLIGCLGLIVVLVLVAVGAVVMMDGEVEIERSQTVSGTPEEVYAVVSNLHTWPDWTAWDKESDPDCTWDFQGEEGDGASMAWEGPVHGNGKLTLRDCVPGQKIEYDMVFLEGTEEMASTGTMELTASADGTTVRWVMNSELEGIGKLFGPLMDGLIGPMFEDGLQGLDDQLGG